MAEIAPKSLVDLDLDNYAGTEKANPELQREGGFRVKDLDDPHGGDGPGTGPRCFDELASAALASAGQH